MTDLGFGSRQYHGFSKGVGEVFVFSHLGVCQDYDFRLKGLKLGLK